MLVWDCRSQCCDDPPLGRPAPCWRSEGRRKSADHATGELHRRGNTLGCYAPPLGTATTGPLARTCSKPQSWQLGLLEDPDLADSRALGPQPTLVRGRSDRGAVGESRFTAGSGGPSTVGIRTRRAPSSKRVAFGSGRDESPGARSVSPPDEPATASVASAYTPVAAKRRSVQRIFRRVIPRTTRSAP